MYILTARATQNEFIAPDKAERIKNMLQGIIIFKLTNIGTKSEGIRPFLYSGNGSFQRVWIKGDYSLNGRMLAEYDGKTVSLEGELNEYDIFCITQITVTNDNKNENLEEKI